jgi:hypothetical protein
MLTCGNSRSRENPAIASCLRHWPPDLAHGCEHFGLRGDLPNRGHGKENLDARSMFLAQGVRGLEIPLLLLHKK